MLSFKYFLSEAPYIMSDFPKTAYQLKDHQTRVRKTGKKIVTMSPHTGEYESKKHEFLSSTSTHNFYRQINDHEDSHTGKSARFIAVNKKNNRMDMSVRGLWSNSKHKKLEVEFLKGHPKSGIRAHEFYHHLVHAGHVNELVSDTSQSEGAKKVWHKLSKMPNIKMGATDGKYHGNFHRNYVAKGKPHFHRPEAERRLTAKADIK